MSERRDPMPATKALLADWDRSTNPIFLSAAGQLRKALRQDKRNDVAEVVRPSAPPDPTGCGECHHELTDHDTEGCVWLGCGCHEPITSPGEVS